MHWELGGGRLRRLAADFDVDRALTILDQALKLYEDSNRERMGHQCYIYAVQLLARSERYLPPISCFLCVARTQVGT